MLHPVLHCGRPTPLTRLLTRLWVEVVGQQRRQVGHWGPVAVAEGAQEATDASRSCATAAIAAAVVVLGEVENEVVELLLLHSALAADAASKQTDRGMSEPTKLPPKRMDVRFGCHTPHKCRHKI